MRALRRWGESRILKVGEGQSRRCQSQGPGGIHLIVTAIKTMVADRNGALVCQVLCQAFYMDLLMV